LLESPLHRVYEQLRHLAGAPRPGPLAPGPFHYAHL